MWWGVRWPIKEGCGWSPKKLEEEASMHIMAGHIKNAGLYSKNKGTYQSFLSKDARLQVCMLKRYLCLNVRN